MADSYSHTHSAETTSHIHHSLPAIDTLHHNHSISTHHHDYEDPSTPYQGHSHHHHRKSSAPPSPITPPAQPAPPPAYGAIPPSQSAPFVFQSGLGSYYQQQQRPRCQCHDPELNLCQRCHRAINPSPIARVFSFVFFVIWGLLFTVIMIQLFRGMVREWYD